MWIAVLAAGAAGWALEPTTPLADYGRQAWGMENGLPQNSVHAVVQTRDGFLWVGTEAGLVRFDGNSFWVLDQNSKPAIPSGDIHCLLAASDGALWVGTSDGLARLKDGVATIFTVKEGLPGNAIRSLHESQQGKVVVSTESGEAAFDGAHFVPVADGMLQTSPALYERTLADKTRVLVTKGDVEIVQGSQRRNWMVGKDLPGTRIQTAFADREGMVWIGTNGGLVRYGMGKLERFPVTDILANASILSIVEDREGDMWIGTETSGLHILRDQRFRNIGAHDGLSSDATTTVVEDAQNRLWVGTNGAGLNVVRLGVVEPGAERIYPVRDLLLSDVILSLAAAPNGDVWVGTPDGLNRIRGGAVDAFTSADGLPDDFIRSLLVDTDGSLWIGTRHGLAHWTFALKGRGSQPEPEHKEIYTQANGLGSDLVGAMTRDTKGNLWVATLAGLSRLQLGQMTNFTTASGLTSNVITALLPRDGGSVVVGTQENGWSLWNGSGFSSTQTTEMKRTNVHAILDDLHGHLWFATANGIARCDVTETAECANWLEFGPADGLRSRETATNSHPSAWRGRDGHLWFATPKGLEEVNPEHFPVNTTLLPVAVERFAVDDVDQMVPQKDGKELKVPAGHNHFQFDYAGLSFVAPQKVRYRYMLEGFDKGWTDAGTRRVAYYTNIPPGGYTFRVQAANNDGLWNTRGTALDFELEPHFYQTIWFYILLTAVLAGVVVLVLRRRLVLAEREFSAVLGERNRIAREIHDTLAQGYVGISVQLEVVAELLRHEKSEAARKQLDTVRANVREGLAEARQSIWALRSQDVDEKTLPVTLRRVTEQADGHGIEATFSVHGAYRPLPPGTEREILRVAQEAIHNVRKHAGAKHLWVRLDYTEDELAMEVRDDGRGFTIGETEVEQDRGHYGLTGMRERAAAIHGRLDVASEPGSGSTVRLVTPAPKPVKEQK
ncbi:MAG TPA: two-component regulator propeller domain-containing protein [Terracidiphilus sp.]|nr:two-component regulator propeller domain-containing protein [Terracidiphilus sp.]